MKHRYFASMLLAAMLVNTGIVNTIASAEEPIEAILDTSEESGKEAEDVLFDIASAPEAEAAEESSGAGKKPKKERKGASLADVKGLIEGANQETISRDLSDGLSWDEIQEEEDSANPAHIPGFSVDPTKYPPANITENTQEIYWYLVDELELNHAAACGVLANIQLESNFRPLAIGDSGTSFGICQWHLGRLASLIVYCDKEGLDYHTVEGQLAYLRYELEGGYAGVLEILKEGEDTPEGAYDAGYWFCMGFEKPDQTLLRSQRRGNLAKNEYFEREFERSEEDAEEETEGLLEEMQKEAFFDLEALREMLLEKIREMRER